MINAITVDFGVGDLFSVGRPLGKVVFALMFFEVTMYRKAMWVVRRPNETRILCA